MKRIIATGAVAALATLGFAGTASAEPMGQATGKPAGIQCMQNGIAALKGVDGSKGTPAGKLPDVAKSGLPVSVAVGLGVTPRDGLPEGITLDTVLPFSLILADHRAGDDSIFVYPWC